MYGEGPRNNEQFDLPLGPKLEKSDLDQVPTLLARKLPNCKCMVESFDTKHATIAIEASGVKSVFTVDLYDLTVTLDREKSYDLFARDGEDYTDIGPRPVQDTETLHEERRLALKQVIEELEYPSLIEED